MRTLIDVSLFVHTRRAWHGKQYFTLATIVVAWSVSHSLAPSLSLSPSPSPSSSLPLSLLVPFGAHLIASSLSLSPAFLSTSPSLSIHTGAQRGAPWNLRSVSHRRRSQPRHATPRTDELYEPRVRSPRPPRSCCARPRVPRGGGLNWSQSGLSSNKCLAISDIRQPDTSNLYVWGPGHGPHVYLGEKIIWMFR